MIAVAHASAGPYTIVKGDAKSCRTCRQLDGARALARSRRDATAEAACAERAMRHFYDAHRVSP
ncbi:hypothetical protein [Streptomyces olivoreticuli]|uniref:hypothetical protein n=1 Tax=Streptomyces olivoreticuli TaxID=68246 RepID=UPI000E28121B|nr:hypothetical protein [Streptomyces olivoreticuli]